MVQDLKAGIINVDSDYSRFLVLSVLLVVDGFGCFNLKQACLFS